MLASNLEVVVKDVGAPAGNVAVTQVRPQPAAVVVTVRNEGPRRIAAPSRLTLDGREVASASVTLAPGTSGDVVIPYQAPASRDAGRLHRRPAGDGRGQPTDRAPRRWRANARRRREQCDREPGRVLGARPGSMSSARSMRRRPKSRHSRPLFVDGARFSKERASLLGGRRQWCCCRRGSSIAAPATPCRGSCAGGGGLIVAAGPDVDADGPGGDSRHGRSPPGIPTEERPRILAVTDLRHPIFRPVRLADRQSRAGVVHARVAAAGGGLGRRGVVHRRRAGAAGAPRR